MKLLTFPIRLLFWLVLLPIKLVLATAGLTFRAGFKAGTLPVKGGVAAGRVLGLKALVLFAAGVALGVVVGRRLGEAGADLAEASYGSPVSGNGSGPEPVATLVEDTIEVVETPEGEIVTETVVVTEIDEVDVEALEAEDEREDELEAQIDIALGETGGELGVDTDDKDR
jgi:hypothetical protein